MPFVKFEVETPQPKQTPDVKIGKLGLSIRRTALEKFGLSDAHYVNLWFDPVKIIGAISASEKADKSSFQAKQRGKTGDNVFIAAGKYYAKFGINVEGKGATSQLKEIDGLASFMLPGAPNDSPKAPPTGAKRGRKAKNAQ